jgi:hypothetical protein
MEKAAIERKKMEDQILEEALKRFYTSKGDREKSQQDSFEFIKNQVEKRTLLFGNDQNLRGSAIKRIGDRFIRESGLVFKTRPSDDINKRVLEEQQAEFRRKSVERMENGEDPENVLLDLEKNLRSLSIPEKDVTKNVEMVLDYFGYDKKKEDDLERVLIDKGQETLPLPKLDLDFDELRSIKLREDDKEILAPVDRPLTAIDPKFSKMNESVREKIGDKSDAADRKVNAEERRTMDKYVAKPGRLVLETEKLSNFIRQVRLSVVTVPIGIQKIRLESILVRSLANDRIDRFPKIFIFGWEDQINEEFYKPFDKLLEMNQTEEDCLFIIRDIKTFNIFAADVLKGVPKNYYLILIDGLISKQDLSVVENVTTDISFLWPSFADIKVDFAMTTSVSVITRESHIREYRNEITNQYQRPDIGYKEIYSNISDQSQVVSISRKILNVSLSEPNMDSLANPGVTGNEALERSPKFRDLLVKMMINADSRIVVKMMPGPYGLDAFNYIYSTLRKPALKPVFVYSSDDFQTKRIKISSIPDTGPCLVITDFTLSDTLIPQNVENFYIAGGGDYNDLKTCLDLAKSSNYNRDIYPRVIQITMFVTKLDGDIVDTVDQIEASEFYRNMERISKNMSKIRSMSLDITVRGQELIVSKKN